MLLDVPVKPDGWCIKSTMIYELIFRCSWPPPGVTGFYRSVTGTPRVQSACTYIYVCRELLLLSDKVRTWIWTWRASGWAVAATETDQHPPRRMEIIHQTSLRRWLTHYSSGFNLVDYNSASANLANLKMTATPIYQILLWNKREREIERERETERQRDRETERESIWPRVVHGSLFLDPTRPDPPERWPDPTRPAITDKKSDPTRPAARPLPNMYSLQLNNYIY